jgi:hypothetical protein
MAINFLNTVNLNKNQLNNAAIQNLAADPAGAVEGQIYFNTVDHDLKIFANGAWKEVGATSGVETLSTTKAGNSTGNPLTVLSNAVGDVTINSFAYAGGSNIGYVPSGGLVNQYMDGTGAWVDVTTGDIESVNASTINNRLGISVTTPLGPDPVVGLNIVGQANLANVVSDDELIIYDKSSTTNKSITVENLVGGYETTYTLPVTAGSLTDPKSGIITLTGSDSSTDPVTFVGTTGRIEIAGSPGASTITVDLTDDVSIVGKIDVLGSATSSFAGDIDMNTNKLTNVATGTVATDGVNLGQVEALVAGIGLFKGGYNANTGLTTDLGVGNNGSLDGASNIALDQGDFFVVTVAGGAFYTETLEVGDMIFANEAILANSTPPLSKYTVVIQDANIAGAGATDGATAKGVAGFDSASFNVTASGWVQLDAQKNPNGAKQSLNNTAPSTRTESGGVTTFTLNLAAASLFGTGALSENVKVEITEGAAPFETVYACVTRSGTASMAIGFTGSVANDAYQVLLTHV